VIRQLIHALLTLLSAAGLVSAYACISKPYDNFIDATDSRVFRCELNRRGDPWGATPFHWHELAPGGFECRRRGSDGDVTSRRYLLAPSESEPESNITSIIGRY
jgi:hypothetical protein